MGGGYMFKFKDPMAVLITLVFFVVVFLGANLLSMSINAEPLTEMRVKLAKCERQVAPAVAGERTVTHSND